MKKITCFMVIGMLLITLLTACSCEHEWVEATCEKPKTCALCQETEGEPMEHSWEEATCEAPKICSVCKKEEGSANGHSWESATCKSPRMCKVCGKEEGDPLEHIVEKWEVTTPATCTEKGVQTGKCLTCKEDITQETKVGEHTSGDWEIVTPATIEAKGEKVKKCTVCGKILSTETIELTAEEKKNAYIAQCGVTYSYEEIARDPDNYKDTYAYFKGEVIQVLGGNSGEAYNLRVLITQSSYGYWSDPIFVYYEPKSASESRILEDDIVTIYGKLSGMYTYETVMGGELTIPLFIAEYVTIE